MSSNRRASSEGRGTLLLAATILSLAATIVAGYLTRLALADSSQWVEHTDEVKLALSGCEIALARGDDAGLVAHLREVQELTVDNPRQQHDLGVASQLAAHGSRAELRDLLASMQGEEDRLMVERRARIESARGRSSLAFLIGAFLTIAFGVGAFARVRAQRQALRAQSALLEAIVESVDEGIIAVEPPPSRRIIMINAAARALWGSASPKEAWPEDWQPALKATYEDGTTMAPEAGPLARAMRGETSEGVVYRVVPADASPSDAGAWISASARPILDELGTVVAAVTTLRDVTEQRADAERLRDLSLTDELTGLFNRRGFLAMSDARLAAARRAKVTVGLLYADVNGLKRINDELGHEQGDRAIEDAATVLRGVFREGDVLARIGGDEFVALLPNFAASAREPLLERLAAAIRSHAEHESRSFRLSVSAGVTFLEWERGQTLEEALAEADRLMYVRKRERAGASMPVLRAVRSPPDGER